MVAKQRLGSAGRSARSPRTPTPAELSAATQKTLPDHLRTGLDILLCGINPGLYSAAIGHHFGRPGNRFWKALYAAGLTPRLFSPFEDAELLTLGIGITNIVPRATSRADELARAELIAGAAALRRKVLRSRPRFLAVVGYSAYRIAFGRPKAQGGLQDETIGSTRVWLLPNTSGLNAHHQPRELRARFEELRLAAQIRTQGRS